MIESLVPISAFLAIFGFGVVLSEDNKPGDVIEGSIMLLVRGVVAGFIGLVLYGFGLIAIAAIPFFLASFMVVAGVSGIAGGIFKAMPTPARWAVSLLFVAAIAGAVVIHDSVAEAQQAQQAQVQTERGLLQAFAQARVQGDEETMLRVANQLRALSK